MSVQRRLLVIAWLGVWSVGGPPAFGGTVNRIVAIVNDEVITAADVDSQVHALADDAEGQGAPDLQAGPVREAALQRLIAHTLMLQEAKRLGVTVTSDDVMQEVGTIREHLGSEQAFQRSLAEAQMSPEAFQQHVRDQLLVKRLIDTTVRPAVRVSPQEVAQVLQAHPELAKTGDRVRAAHLLIRVTEERPDADALALIGRLRRQLEEGAEFAALARRFSEDESKEDGGSMGWVAQGELLPELDAALFHLAPGSVSEPIRTRLGFHLLKAEARQPSSALDAAQAQRAVYEQLYQRKFQEAFERWLEELKRKAYIEMTDQPDRSAAAR